MGVASNASNSLRRTMECRWSAMMQRQQNDRWTRPLQQLELAFSSRFQTAVCLRRLLEVEANWIYCPLSADEWSNMFYCHIIARLLFNWEVTVLMSLYAVNYYYFLLHIFLISLAVLHPKLVCVVFLLLFPVHSQNKTYDECFSWMEPSESMEWS